MQNTLTPPSGGEQVKKLSDKSTSSKKNTNEDQVQLNISIPRATFDTLQKLGNVTDVLNETAKSLRATGNGLTAADDLASKMRSKLETITKNYPPFPIDSSERRDILMSYRALQKEMEKMMIPAPPAPVYDKVKTLWQDLFGQNQTGSVSTPSLPDTAPDTAVAGASEQLASTSDSIANLHTAIGATL